LLDFVLGAVETREGVGSRFFERLHYGWNFSKPRNDSRPLWCSPLVEDCMRIPKQFGILIGLVAALSVAALRARSSHDDDEPKPGKAMSGKGRTIVIRLGLKDTVSTGWGGEIKLSEGTVTSLSVAGAGDADGQFKWKAKSKVAKKKKKAGVVPVEIYATIDAPPKATVTVNTRQGNFSFALEDITDEKGKSFLDNQARVSSGPMSVAITDQPTDDDFPAAAAAPDGTVWVAYVAYKHGNPIDLPTDGSLPKNWSSLVTKGNGDQVKLLKYDGKTWSTAIDITEPGLDVWRPCVVADAKGKVWVIWSQNNSGNWDLHARSYDPAEHRKSGIERVTSEQGSDINVVATLSKSGKVWLAWQRWEGNDFAIRAQSLGENKTSRRTRNFNGNEWSPSIAADSKGKIHIAFDSYTAGNYDVYLWTIDEDVSGPQGATLPIATSPLFEARPSIAVDKQDRVWVAYEEADPNWGKDFGTKWTGKTGVPFYLERRIQVRVVSGREIEQPKGEIPSTPIDTMYGGGRRVRTSMPRIACDGDGRMWLLYRRHPLGTGAGEVWNGFATYHSGDQWSPEIPLPNSENFIDNRPALARLSSGALAAIYSTDKRVATTQSGVDNDLHACVLSADGSTRKSVLVPVPPPDNVNADPIHPNEADDIKRMREFRVTTNGKNYQLLRGEFHRHTELSSHRDQDGPFEEIWRYGLDVARMDWIGQGDHDNGQREYTWWLSQKQDDMYFHPPTFMPMFTYERSVVYPSGHRNVIFARRGIRPLPRLGRGEDDELLMGTKESGSPDVKRLYAYLKHFDGICASHTSATGMGTDWRDNDPDVEPVVEIYQGHRQNYEYEGAPQSAKEGDTIGNYRPAGFVWNALRKGYRLGFEVSSDHVSTHLSYAVVLVEQPTREAIVDAFKKRHSYGAQDNIVLAVTSGEHLMGDEFTVRSPPELRVQAVGTGPIARVSIIRGVGNNVPTYVYDATPNETNVNLTWKDEMAVAGEKSYYYVRIEQTDGKLAWASPMWIKYVP
jgi:hypothetical protein